MPRLNFGDNFLHGQAVGIELARVGAKLKLSTLATEVTDTGVYGKSEDGRSFFEADSVVLALGFTAKRDEADELRMCAPEFHQIGDCLSVKTIYEATRTAHHIALGIGER
jgi:hypothetical protein